MYEARRKALQEIIERIDELITSLEELQSVDEEVCDNMPGITSYLELPWYEDYQTAALGLTVDSLDKARNYILGAIK